MLAQGWSSSPECPSEGLGAQFRGGHYWLDLTAFSFFLFLSTPLAGPVLVICIPPVAFLTLVPGGSGRPLPEDTGVERLGGTVEDSSCKHTEYTEMLVGLVSGCRRRSGLRAGWRVGGGGCWAPRPQG